jgi:hypothetical protein
MTAFLYWPYDEVTLESPAEGNAAEVKSPWLTATVRFKEEDRDRIEALSDKFATGSLNPADIELVNWFFAELDHYPFCYIVPTAKDEEALDAHGLKDSSLLALTFSDFLPQSVGSATEFSTQDAAELVSSFQQKDWTWDAEAALGFAQINGKVHPEALFTVVRRFHLLDVLERDQGRDKFAFIETLKGEDFARAASLLVRQNHYVTKMCQQALLPAVKTAGQAKPLVEAFVREENGHDLILNVALKALTSDPDAVAVALPTKAVMHLLQFAAERNFLAFAMAVDFFERSSYQEIDPLAQLLSKGGFDKAAKQINRHMEINDAGGHENVALSFLGSMAPCDPDYALEALRIAETLSLVMNGITSSAVDLYHQGR